MESTHQNSKIIIMLAVSTVFAVIAIISGFYAMKLRNVSVNPPANENTQISETSKEPLTEEKQEKPKISSKKSDYEIYPEDEVVSMDDLNIDKFENAYSEELLDKFRLEEDEE